MFVIPRLSSDYIGSGTIQTNGFTIGKKYEIIGKQGAGYIVRNDNGHERFISDSDKEKSPHITRHWIDKIMFVGLSIHKQESFGYFEFVE